VGQYQCQVTVEGFPPVSSPPYTLHLVTKPRILSPGHQSGVVGSMARLQCRVHTQGNNNLISWDRRGAVLSGQEPGITLEYSQGEGEQTSDLVIHWAREEDFGEYGCKAANEAGVDYHLIQLTREDTGLGLAGILYILLGLFILATLTLVVVLCVILYQRRKRSNLKYLRAAKQEQDARERMEECPEDVKDWARQEPPQPDLIQPLPRGGQTMYPRSVSGDISESDDDLPIMQDFETRIYNSPQRRPFAIDRFLNHPPEPTYSLRSSGSVTSHEGGMRRQTRTGVSVREERSQGDEEEEQHQFVTLLPA